MRLAIHLLLSSFFIVLAPSSFALSLYLPHPVVTFNANYSLAKQTDESITFPEIDNSFYRYTADRGYKAFKTLGIFVANESQLDSGLKLQLGLAYYRSVDLTPGGHVTQGPDAQSSDTYRYRYTIESDQLVLQAKIATNLAHCFHPYLMAGIGEAFNKKTGYAVDVSPFLTFTPAFDTRWNYSVMYNLSVGLDVDITSTVRAGLGYRFANLGKTKFDKTTLDTLVLNNSLKSSRIYSHEIAAQLTYLF